MTMSPADFDRLENNGKPLQSRGGNLFSNETDWARYFSKKTFTLPIQIDLYARMEWIHGHATDARPYDGLSFLWGRPQDPNETDYNINLLKREPNGPHPNLWQKEFNHKYYKLSPDVRPLPWQLREWRLFQILMQTDGTLQMLSDGKMWLGKDSASVIRSGRIGLRADRCIVDMKINVFEGRTTMARRIAGTDKFGTSAAASRDRYPNGADTVYLVTGDKFPDGITGAQYANSGPLLLVTRDTLPEPIALEIKRLKAKNVVAIGGPGVISDAVVSLAERCCV